MSTGIKKSLGQIEWSRKHLAIEPGAFISRNILLFYLCDKLISIRLQELYSRAKFKMIQSLLCE